MRAACACAAAWLLALVAGAAGEGGAVSVVRMQLTFEQLHSLNVTNAVEYILEFVPTGDQGAFPSRLLLRSSGGDTARPMLLTARQTNGAQTWQLPYAAEAGAGAPLLYELERTLCPDGDGGGVEGDPCVGAGAPAPRGQFSLHVSSSCATPLRLDAMATPLRDWRLHRDQPHTLEATQAAAALRHYAFAPGEDSVRLTLQSLDDVCATVAVQNYTCPIPETPAELGLSGLRMTVQRSGAVQLSRSAFPRGFVVVVALHAADTPCSGAEEPAADWLWEAVLGVEPAEDPEPPPRVKGVTILVRSALSRGQYAVAAVSTLALFLLFYVAFGALVLAQRYPPLARWTKPRAVLAPKQHDQPDEPAVPADAQNEETAMDADIGHIESPARRRRGSDATYDSSDDSATESDEEQPARPPPSAPGPRAAPPAGGAATHADSADVTDGAAAAPAVPAAGEQLAGLELNGMQPPRVEAGEEAGVEAGEEAAAAPTPFGLPARLNVAALARRRARTLRARSDRYLYTLYTVAVFYALPVVQFVAAFQLILNVSGSLDLCYYNFMCAHPAGALSDFNHVFSNLGYLLLGALFILQVHRRRARRRRKPRHEEYGIPAHYGMLMSLGAGMMMVALLSASYHVCPNQLNFQFDTAFMYVLAVLSMVKIYQSRHPDINARAHATFGVLAVLIALVVWGVLAGGALFWGVFTVLHVFTFLLLSLRIYYVGQFRLDKESLAETRRGLRDLRPLYSARLVLVVIANAVNWLFALYGLFWMPADFAGHLLSVLLCNTLLHMLFYLSMKLLHGERPRWYAWLYLAGAAAAWAPALYFFTYGSSDWAATPALSRHSNHECKVLQFYDSHDLWHMLSAVALYLSFNAMLTWDDGLSAVRRTDIAVF